MTAPIRGLLLLVSCVATTASAGAQTAQEIAKKIKDAYVERGWMSR